MSIEGNKVIMVSEDEIKKIMDKPVNKDFIEQCMKYREMFDKGSPIIKGENAKRIIDEINNPVDNSQVFKKCEKLSEAFLSKLGGHMLNFDKFKFVIKNNQVDEIYVYNSDNYYYCDQNKLLGTPLWDKIHNINYWLDNDKYHEFDGINEINKDKYEEIRLYFRNLVGFRV